MEGSQYNMSHDGVQYNGASFDPNTSNMSFQSPSAGAQKLPRPRSDPLDALAALPELRPIPWISGRELPADKSTESTRTQTRGAFLMSTRGIVRDPPCSHCATGAGRFSLCVSLAGWFGGACATCQALTRANHCTLRMALEGTAPVTSGENGTKHSPQGLNSGHPQPQKKKRKRQSTPASIIPTSHPQELSSPEHETARGYEAGSYAAPQNAAPAQDTNQGDGLLQYVFQKLNPPEGKKRHHIISRTMAEGQESYLQTARHANGTQNVGAGPSGRYHAVQDSSASLSPSGQLQQAAQPQQYTGPYTSNGAAQRSASRDDGTSLFDALPRKKQKQVLGIIGGLQSGIRMAKQQTDHLQQQLDALQSALGIVNDEDEDG